ncbi:MAG TPA: antitoxin Xre/MbcA/ParS toxin-binding domain-containing protein [Chthoniobacterales bacterium]|nr:antitoxin Xre/MbcA/ParS toxin-binding domain-containing protein [Chthoniobacterales bacterium]
MATAAVKKSAALSVQQQIGQIQAGLSFRAVRSLQNALDLPLEKIAAFLGMSRATLHRRKAQGKIARRESERLVRYQTLLKRAEEVFGNAASAREWLIQPQVGLGNARPVEFARTEIGAREVENLLGRIEYGVYS